LDAVKLGLADEAAGADLTLQEVIWINEEVKQVVGITRAIRLEAINAMLISRRAGAAAVGFKVVSNELRIFSARVEERMAGLSDLIYALTMVAADREKGLRMYHYFLNAAQVRQTRECDYLDDLLARELGSLEGLACAIRAEREKLHRRALLIWKDCGMGRSLARNARIEAVTGGGMAMALMQVANQVETTVERIHAILSKLKNFDMEEQA
jgi:hypothetical protein